MKEIPRFGLNCPTSADTALFPDRARYAFYAFDTNSLVRLLSMLGAFLV